MNLGNLAVPRAGDLDAAMRLPVFRESRRGRLYSGAIARPPPAAKSCELAGSVAAACFVEIGDAAASCCQSFPGPARSHDERRFG